MVGMLAAGAAGAQGRGDRIPIPPSAPPAPAPSVGGPGVRVGVVPSSRELPEGRTPTNVMPLLAQRGTLRGTVQSVDWRHGTVGLMTQQGPVTLQAMPGQVASLEPGRTVSLDYVLFAGTPWMMSHLGQQLPPKHGRIEEASGLLARVDVDAGVARLRTPQGFELPLRAHPAWLERFRPGQFVAVTYQDLGGNPWVASMREQGVPPAVSTTRPPPTASGGTPVADTEAAR